MKEIRTSADEWFSLANIALFDNLTTDELVDFESQCRWREYLPGDQIIIHGAEDTDVFFLVKGSAHVLYFSDSGRIVDYAALRQGDVFGELAAIDDLPRSASIAAVSVCTVAVISGEKFLNLVTDHRSITLALLVNLAGIIRLGNERISDLSLLGAEQRVCLELLRAASPDPADRNKLVIYPVPTQSHIAEKTGVARETVARIFGHLSHDRIIERKSKTIYIRKVKELERLAISP